jgi:hypothetical protein
MRCRPQNYFVLTHWTVELDNGIGACFPVLERSARSILLGLVFIWRVKTDDCE